MASLPGEVALYPFLRTGRVIAAIKGSGPGRAIHVDRYSLLRLSCARYSPALPGLEGVTESSAEALGYDSSWWIVLSPEPEHRYYPVFLELRERLCVVVGGGAVAAEKTEGLLRAGAQVRVVAPALEEPLARWVREGLIEHIDRRYRRGDLKGAFLVLAERIAHEAQAELFAEAEERRIFANVQDVVPYCSFAAPAIHRQGDLAVAISTGGSAPALAVRLKERLGEELGPEYGAFLDLARRSRRPLSEKVADFDERRRRWYELVDSKILHLLRQGRSEAAEQLLTEILGVVPEGDR